MLLAIDIGNTNIVFAVFDGEALKDTWRAETHGGEFPQIELSITQIVIASVVPAVNDRVAKHCFDTYGVEPVFVSKDHIDIEIALDKPEEVGADRLVNAHAVKALYSAPAIVIDFGTATTFDVVNVKGAYAGGVIAPGVNLSVSALEAAAAKLPEIEVTRPAVIIGSNTVHAMQSGVYFGYQGLVENITRRIADEIGDTPYVVATGGLAPLFARDCDVIDCVDQDLTLKGLRMIAASMKD